MGIDPDGKVLPSIMMAGGNHTKNPKKAKDPSAMPVIRDGMQHRAEAGMDIFQDEIVGHEHEPKSLKKKKLTNWWEREDFDCNFYSNSTEEMDYTQELGIIRNSTPAKEQLRNKTMKSVEYKMEKGENEQVAPLLQVLDQKQALYKSVPAIKQVGCHPVVLKDRRFSICGFQSRCLHYLLLLVFLLVLSGASVSAILYMMRLYGDNEAHNTLSSIRQYKKNSPFASELLPEYTWSAIANNNLGGRPSPQSSAYEWLLADPHLATYSTNQKVQRFVLATLYFSTRGGLDWHSSESWLSVSVSECGWYSTTKSNTEICDADGNYLRLSLSSNGLEGTLPAEIGLLSTLIELNLDFNRLTGGIPSTVGNMIRLNYLSLSWNRLSGSLPVEIGNLENLITLSMEGNALDQAIPTEIGQLHRLEKLVLSQRQGGKSGLVGKIPSELGQMESLKELNLQFNKLSGTIPSELMQLQFLQVLVLDFNRLTGTIPTHVGLQQPQQLVQLSLSDNRFEGTIPSQLGNLNQLRGLYLHSNRLTGTIPLELSQLSSTLNRLRLDANRLTGKLPSELGQLTQLEWLLVGKNNLQGGIPMEVGNQLKQLQILQLDNNSMSGGIDSLGGLERLQDLSVNGNSFLGTLPKNLCFLYQNGDMNLKADCFSLDCNCGCFCGA